MTEYSCAYCKYYQECLKTFKNTILSETMELKDCSCYMWQKGENEIQISLFEGRQFNDNDEGEL